MLTALLKTYGAHLNPLRDLINDSTLLLAPSGDAAELWQQMLTAGSGFELRVGGHLAQKAFETVAAGRRWPLGPHETAWTAVVAART